MELFRWIASGILASLALLLIGWNAYFAVGGILGRVRNKSWIPVLGGLCGVGALLAAPVDGLGFFWWAPLLADWGCIPGFTHTLVAYLSRRRPPPQRRSAEAPRMKRSWPALILSLLLFMAIPVAAVVVAAMVSSNWWLLALVPVLVLLTHRFTDRGYAWFASRLSKG